MSLTKEQRALAQVMSADEAEGQRANWWLMISPAMRRLVLHMARLDPQRAELPLSEFLPAERERMHTRLIFAIADLGILLKCTEVPLAPPPVVDQVGALTRQAELERHEDEARRQRIEFKRLQEQEQEQQQGRGRLH